MQFVHKNKVLLAVNFCVLLLVLTGMGLAALPALFNSSFFGMMMVLFIVANFVLFAGVGIKFFINLFKNQPVILNEEIK